MVVEYMIVEGGPSFKKDPQIRNTMSLTQFVRENYHRESLKDVLENYLIADGGNLPEDNLRCVKELEDAMNLYIKLNGQKHNRRDKDE